MSPSVPVSLVPSPQSVSAPISSVVNSTNLNGKSHHIEQSDIKSVQDNSLNNFPRSLDITSGSAVSVTGGSSFVKTENLSHVVMDGQSDVLSPVYDSSEEHAEIDCTSTEASVENNRLEPDVLDTRTEDEAPDIDDDVLPFSAVHGPYLSERLLSVEATEDTDITTPMEMRDSHTERDTNASQLESVDGRDSQHPSDDISLNDTNEREISEFQELPASFIDVEVDTKEASISEIKDSEVFVDDTADPIGDSFPANVVESPSYDKIPNNERFKSVLTAEYGNVWPTDENRKARRTESTVVETGSTDDCSPSDSKSRERSFSDLVDSDEINRDSLEEEFDKLYAEADSPSSIPSLHNDHVIDEHPNTTHCKSSNLIPSSPLQPTILEAGTKTLSDIDP